MFRYKLNCHQLHNIPNGSIVAHIVVRVIQLNKLYSTILAYSLNVCAYGKLL